MKNKFPIYTFVAVQLSSLAVLTLWIVWYTASRVMFAELSRKYGVDPAFYTSFFWLLQGILLMLPVIAGATIIFIYWTKTRALDKMRTDLISGVSHELLTPIASLRLYIETMMLRSVEKEKKAEFLALMLEDTERLSITISKLLVASRLENKMVDYHFVKTDLAQFIEIYLDENSQRLKDVEIELDLNKGCFAAVDSDSFITILKNIFENAVKYSEDKAAINIATRCEESKVLFSVSDHGEGLAQKDRKRIFNMFYRARKRKEGTGLGLYIVKQIVKAHKGKVWADQNPDGRGTRINILLPACESEGE
jgi:signal transduction histidine kinase